MNYQKLMILLIWPILAFTCKHSIHSSITALSMLNFTDTNTVNGRTILNKVDYYLVEGYADSKYSAKVIDSFAHRNKDVNVQTYGLYKMVFYKKSDKTNAENLSAHPRDLYRYSEGHDLIYEYLWVNGKFGERTKFKNGAVIEPKHKIEIEDISNE